MNTNLCFVVYWLKFRSWGIYLNHQPLIVRDNSLTLCLLCHYASAGWIIRKYMGKITPQKHINARIICTLLGLGGNWIGWSYLLWCSIFLPYNMGIIFVRLSFWPDESPRQYVIFKKNPDSKVHGANMGPTWVLSAPDGPHVGLMNLAIRESKAIRTQECIMTLHPISVSTLHVGNIL